MTLRGAPYGARSEDAVNSRNGYQGLGDPCRDDGGSDPKLRQGSYFPDTAVATCYLLGVGESIRVTV